MRQYQTSAVDLLKMLDIDSSLDACKQLATQLYVHVAADRSTEENIALYECSVPKDDSST